VAIATAFVSPLINDLHYTKDQLDSPLKQVLCSLHDLVKEDHRNYRGAFAEASRRSHERIPWLRKSEIRKAYIPRIVGTYITSSAAVHLTDLRAILDQYPATHEHNGHTLINFERYVHFRTYLQEQIPSHREAYADLEQYRNKGQLAYVQWKLSSVVLGDKSLDAELETRASMVRKNEQRDKNHRDSRGRN
jgi:hypothetical protein